MYGSKKISNEKEKTRNNKGITLIALIVTIIILLILAGVTINVTLGEKGLFKTAKDAVTEHEKAQLKEELEIEIANIQSKKIANGEELSRENLWELAGVGATMTSVGIPAEGEYKDYFFEIDENYNVTIIGKLQGEKPSITGEVITTGIVAQGGKVEIKVTASITEGTIQNIEATNGALLKTETSTTNKIFEVSSNGIYYFKTMADNGRSATVAVEVNTIIEKPEISIKDITDVGFTIIVNTNYAEGIVTEYKYYVDGILKSPENTTAKEYTVIGLTAGTVYENIYVEASFNGSILASDIKKVTTNKVLITSITLNKNETTIEKGKTDSLTASIEPSNATDKTFTATSGNNSIATVTVSGNTVTVTAVAKGSTTITVTANDGSEVSTVCDVTVHVPGEIDYSWEELDLVAKVISDTPTITLDTNEVNVTYNGKEYSLKVGDATSINGKKVRILGFNHDKLTDTAAYGGNNTYAGISFEYVDFITSDSAIKNTNTNSGGWGTCTLRTTLNGSLYNEIKNIVNVKQVQKAYCAKYSSDTLSYSNDYLWLLSCAEIWNDGVSSTGKGFSSGIEGEQYKYYKNINALCRTGNNFIKKPSNVSGTSVKGDWWWLRSNFYYGTSYWSCVEPSGYVSITGLSSEYGVAPGFSI